MNKQVIDKYFILNMYHPKLNRTREIVVVVETCFSTLVQPKMDESYQYLRNVLDKWVTG